MSKQYTKIIGSIKDFHNELQSLRYVMETNIGPYIKEEIIETQCEVLLHMGGFIWNISTLAEDPKENKVLYYGSWVNNQFLVYAYPINEMVSYIDHSIGALGMLDYEEPKLYYPAPGIKGGNRSTDPTPPKAG